MRTFVLPRGHRALLGGRPVGIHVMNPDPGDPAARVGVGGPVDRAGGHGSGVFEVRPGDVIDVGDLVLLITEVVTGPAGFVTFEIRKESTPA